MRRTAWGLSLVLLGACPDDGAPVNETDAGSDTSASPATVGTDADDGPADTTTGPAACTSTQGCVEIPEGFSGPVVLAVTPIDATPPTCQGAYAQPLMELFSGIAYVRDGEPVVDGAGSCVCGCGDVIGEVTCDMPTLRAYDPALGCGQFPVLDAWDRLATCGPLGSTPPAGAIYGIGPTELFGECEGVVLDAQIPAATFATQWTVCAATEPARCDTGTCLPDAPAGFDAALCLVPEDAGMPCPEAFPLWTTGYTGLEDTRTCDDRCMCTAAGQCHWTAELGACGSPGLLVEECTPDLDVTGISEATFFGPTIDPPTCTSSPDPKPVGGRVIETGAASLCCQLPD